MAGTIDNCKLTVKAEVLQLSSLDLGAAYAQHLQDWTVTLTNGTGTGQASQAWSDTRNLAASASENLDLAGSLVNSFGVTLTFTKIMAIFVKASASNNAANNVNFLRGSSNGFAGFLAASDGISLPAGAFAAFHWPGGITVGAGTSDILTVTNSAGTNAVDYSILIVGTD